MADLFSEHVRRNPYPLYDQLRAASPALRVPPPFDAWMLLDYDSVKWALNDHTVFSSRVPAPRNWFIFFDPPAHTRLRALVAQAFTPRTIAGMEPRIRELSRELLDALIERGEIDLAAEYSVPLAMKVIAEILGIPLAGWARYRRWSDTILRLSYGRSRLPPRGRRSRRTFPSCGALRRPARFARPTSGAAGGFRAAEGAAPGWFPAAGRYAAGPRWLSPGCRLRMPWCGRPPPPIAAWRSYPSAQPKTVIASSAASAFRRMRQRSDAAQ